MATGSNVRSKLFISIFTVLLFATTLLGYIAYQSAATNFRMNQNTLLKDSSAQLLSDYIHDLDEFHNDGNIKGWLKNHSHQSLNVQVIKPDQQRITETSNFQLPANVIAHITESRKASGNTKHADFDYFWVKKDIDSTPDTLLITHRLDVNIFNGFMSTLGVPFTVTLFITLWMSVWLSMYMATLYEKLHRQKEELKHQALHDGLTGLPNRTLMADRLEQALLTAERDKAKVGLLFIDLNFFKSVNDSLGHDCGDKLLEELSRRLTAEVRRSDTVARLGGDEFGVVLRNVNVESSKFVAEKILFAIEQVVEINSNKLYVSASIGISLYPDHATVAGPLIKCADTAMYTAKKSGTNILLYNSDLDASSREKLQLVNDLRESLRSGSVEVWYQPIVDIKQDAVYSIEALLRWSHPAFGSVDSRHFTTIAENAGLMKPLTNYMLDIALPDFVKTREKGLIKRLQINVSLSNLQDGEFIPNLLEKLEHHGIQSHEITLEVAEKTMATNAQYTYDRLNQLSKSGFNIVVDDFGTSYSSLSNLQDLKVSGIKIHDELVRNTTNREQNSSIIKAAIQLGHALNLKVFAEGIENEKALRNVHNFSCDFAQGHMFAEALPIAALCDWIQKYNDNPEKKTGISR